MRSECVPAGRSSYCRQYLITSKNGDIMAARSFLWVIVGLVMLALASALTYRLFGEQILKASMVPSITFEESALEDAPDYRRQDMWLARPDQRSSPALLVPEGYEATSTPQAATFYVTPTAYLRRSHWNSPLSEADMDLRLNSYLQNQASAFNGVSTIWSPRYRQATFGAFLTSRPDAELALDVAYQDVLQAFETFVANIPANQPIILAAHSQGSLHLMRLLKERVANTSLTSRIIAAYLVGWPVSIQADVPALGLAPCTSAKQTGCILSWQSFAEPADTGALVHSFEKGNGLTGMSRKNTDMLCTNPLTGAPDSSADASANPGSLHYTVQPGLMTMEKATVGARCENGFLIVGKTPESFNGFVLPGNNYHVYDYALFWAALRQDIQRRSAIFLAGHSKK